MPKSFNPFDERKRARYRRAFERKFKPYAIEIGLVVHSWNRLQEVLGRIFWGVTRMDGMISARIWYSQNDDRAQRRLLASAIEGARQIRTITPELACEITWILEKCNTLAGRRNATIHSPFAFDPASQTFGGAHHFGNPNAAKLKGKDLIKEFRWYRSWADELADYGERVDFAVRDPGTPLPDRPRLPTVGQNSPPQKPQRRKTGDKQHRRQPRPSGA
jgi:hypothetical protein